MEYPIEVKRLKKVYRLYKRPADRLKEIILRRPFHVDFEALNNITFNVKEAETFGLIGENGAGKSTLLKILAGTLRPTSGQCKLKGRVSALLELGSSFHPELSGRENVYLQAAILGLGKREVEAIYPEIVEFSELDPLFLDRPVKTYSSGMFVRLAFAVATCTDPDVLLVDEFLSVGDIHFQKKSLDRIMSFRKAGKTILFCSHNMYQIRNLCQRAIWLKDGKIEAFGETENVVAAYEQYQRRKNGLEEDELPINIPSQEEQRQAGGDSAPVKLEEIRLLNETGQESLKFQAHERIFLEIKAKVIDAGAIFHVALVLERDDGLKIFFSSTKADEISPIKGCKNATIRLEIPELPLLSGLYKWYVYLLDEHAIQVFDMAEGILTFTVRADPKEMCLVYIPHRWIIEKQ